MPLPKPLPDEDEKTFMSRCLSDKLMNSEYPDQKQRTAVCNSQFKKAKETTESFNCECIKCGYKMVSEKHCADIKCPKCGGQMRREGRPGQGQEVKRTEDGKIIVAENVPIVLTGTIGED